MSEPPVLDSTEVERLRAALEEMQRLLFSLEADITLAQAQIHATLYPRELNHG